VRRADPSAEAVGVVGAFARAYLGVPDRRDHDWAMKKAEGSEFQAGHDPSGRGIKGARLRRKTSGVRRGRHGGRRLTEAPEGWTFAVGVAARRPAAMTPEMTRRHVHDMVLVSDAGPREAVRLLVRLTHNLAEGAGAAAPAASDCARAWPGGGWWVCSVGGNLNLRELPQILPRPGAGAGRPGPVTTGLASPQGAGHRSAEARSVRVARKCTKESTRTPETDHELRS
jgi:hypothetical protein